MMKIISDGGKIDQRRTLQIKDKYLPFLPLKDSTHSPSGAQFRDGKSLSQEGISPLWGVYSARE